MCNTIKIESEAVFQPKFQVETSRIELCPWHRLQQVHSRPSSMVQLHDCSSVHLLTIDPQTASLQAAEAGPTFRASSSREAAAAPKIANRFIISSFLATPGHTWQHLVTTSHLAECLAVSQMLNTNMLCFDEICSTDCRVNLDAYILLLLLL